ncbi:MAG: glycosyltransferase family 4 protein [Candidatus Micrarchaeota archaeon]
MQGTGIPHTPQKMAYLHFGSRFPFPINPIFFGQTFVMGNLTAAARHYEGRRNFVMLRDLKGLARDIAGHEVMNEPLMGEKARTLAKARFNTDIRIGYKPEKLDDVIGLVRNLADEGYKSALVFHFPVSPDTQYAYVLRRALEMAGLIDHASIHFYLHTNADNHYHRPNEEMFSVYHASMVRAADGIIGVSQAVRDNFVKLRVRDKGQELRLNPEKAFVVRNGIDPHIYVIKDEREVTEARKDLGLADGLEKVVSFAGRMDRLKGSDYLIKVLEHYEASTDPALANTGFVIATSHLLNVNQASKPFKGLLRMQRLIREDRLKVVIDISKYTRGDPRFRENVEYMLFDFALRNGLQSALRDPLFHQMYGCTTNVPVQSISDLYLHPSRSEAFGLAILEAVFSGAYVISTPVGGIPEIIVDPRLGTLVPIDSDKNTFVKKLIMAICGSNKPNVYNRAGLEAYFESYTDRFMFEQFEKAIRGGMER